MGVTRKKKLPLLTLRRRAGMRGQGRAKRLLVRFVDRGCADNATR